MEMYRTVDGGGLVPLSKDEVATALASAAPYRQVNGVAVLLTEAEIAQAAADAAEMDAAERTVAWRELREERNRRLAATDGLVNPPPDRPVTVDIDALLAYRQALRNLPETVEDPRRFDWSQIEAPQT